MRRRVGALLVLLVAGVSALPVATGDQAMADDLSCGDTITVDTTLTADLVDCPNNGIVIGADNITLDLAGHVVDGDGTEFTACPPDEFCDVGILDVEHHGVTIKGGAVREFGLGTLVLGGSDMRLTHLAVSDNLFSGLVMVESARTEIRHVTATANGLTTDQAGIGIFDSSELTIVKNRVTRNGDIGMFLIGVEHSRIDKNVLAGNPEAAIILEGSANSLSRNRGSGNHDAIILVGDENTVARNRFRGAECDDECGYGVSLEGGSGNVITRNVFVRFHWAGIRLASFAPETPPTFGNVVRRNVIRHSDVDGVLVESTATDTLLARNLAIGAGDDGFDVDNTATTVTRNRAFRNGDLGIEAPAGVIDGGGNRANANGDPVQCTGVQCR